MPEGTIVSEVDIKGNKQADTLVSIAAARACVPLNVSAPVLYYECLVKRIQNRLATIILNLPDRKIKKERQIRAAKVTLESLLVSASHNVTSPTFVTKQHQYLA